MCCGRYICGQASSKHQPKRLVGSTPTCIPPRTIHPPPSSPVHSTHCVCSFWVSCSVLRRVMLWHAVVSAECYGWLCGHPVMGCVTVRCSICMCLVVAAVVTSTLVCWQFRSCRNNTPTKRSATALCGKKKHTQAFFWACLACCLGRIGVASCCCVLYTTTTHAVIINPVIHLLLLKHWTAQSCTLAGLGCGCVCVLRLLWLLLDSTRVVIT